MSIVQSQSVKHRKPPHSSWVRLCSMEIILCQVERTGRNNWKYCIFYKWKLWIFKRKWISPLAPLRTLFFSFKSSLCMFIVHGAVPHEDFFILICSVYLSMSPLPSHLSCSLLSPCVSWSLAQLYFYSWYVCCQPLLIYADMTLRPGMWGPERMGQTPA